MSITLDFKQGYNYTRYLKYTPHLTEQNISIVKSNCSPPTSDDYWYDICFANQYQMRFPPISQFVKITDYEDINNNSSEFDYDAYDAYDASEYYVNTYESNKALESDYDSDLDNFDSRSYTSEEENFSDDWTTV